MVAPPTARHNQSVEQLLLDAATYTVATDQQAERAGGGITRAWQQMDIDRQEASKAVEFTEDIGDFTGGYGKSFAVAPNSYEQANGWDLGAPGKAATWGPIATCAPFTASEERAWIIPSAPFFYILKGRYAVKYRLGNTHGATLAIEQFFDFGNILGGLVVAGRPRQFNGKWYVPLQTRAGTPERFVELTTIVDPGITEVQTVVISGTPTGGTYALTFNIYSTTTLAFNANQAAVQAALRLLPGLASVTVSTAGSAPNFTHTITMTAAPGLLLDTSPRQLTSDITGLTGGSPAIAHATTTAGQVDTWTRGPAGREAQTFANWSHPISGYSLVRADGAAISIATTDPMTAGSWGAEYTLGDPNDNILALEERTPLLLAGKRDGLFHTDETTLGRKVPLGVNEVVDQANFIGMKTSFGYLVFPHQTGLWRWRPGALHQIGAEEGGGIEGDLATGWGRVFAMAEYGKQLYAVIADNLNGRGSLVSYTAPSMVPHMHANFASASVEAVEIVAGETHPGVPFTATFPIQWQRSWDQASFLVVAVTDASHNTVTAQVYQLGSHGLSPGSDPNVNGAVDDAEIRTSRITAPGGQAVQGTFRSVEWWQQTSLQTGHPGVEVQAQVDEETPFNLEANAEAGTPADFSALTTGAKEAFFPVDAGAIGNSCQLRFQIPALGGGEAQVAVELRDIKLHGTWTPLMTEEIEAVLVIGQRVREDGTFDRRTAETQKAALSALARPGTAPIPYKDPWGGSGYCEVFGLRIVELPGTRNRGQEWLAVVKIRRSRFGS
jgi:hypothetical protein